jgi:hypothetical protein
MSDTRLGANSLLKPHNLVFLYSCRLQHALVGAERSEYWTHGYCAEQSHVSSKHDKHSSERGTNEHLQNARRIATALHTPSIGCRYAESRADRVRGRLPELRYLIFFYTPTFLAKNVSSEIPIWPSTNTPTLTSYSPVSTSLNRT